MNVDFMYDLLQYHDILQDVSAQNTSTLSSLSEN